LKALAALCAIGMAIRCAHRATGKSSRLVIQRGLRRSSTRWRITMADIKIRYAFPDPALFDLVVAYLEISISGDDPVHDLLPPDIPSLRFALSGEWGGGPHVDALANFTVSAKLFGPTTSSQWVQGHGGTAFGIGLQPLAWDALLHAKASDHANKMGPLSDLWGDGASNFLCKLVTAADFDARVAQANTILLARTSQCKTPDIRSQIAIIRGALADPHCASVDDMAERVGISQSRLARLCKAYFGFPPKMLIKRERFRRMLHRMDAMSYANWRSYIEGQYVDQSHMIRDFNQFLGMAPSHYMALNRPIVAAAFETFRDMMGTTPQ
jgi:AraC-like DNA-binding protein